jgi:transposase
MKLIYVGIDVAKSKHNCCILNNDGGVCASFTFGNDKAGFEKMTGEIRRFSEEKDLSDAKIGLESTGHYSTNLTDYLLRKRLSVKIFNPLTVSFALKASSLRKTKTDKSDSKFLAELLFADRSKPYQQPVYPISELKTHTRSRHRLVAMRSKLKVSISRMITIVFPELPSVVYSVNQKSTYALLLAFPTAQSIANAHLPRLTTVLKTSSNGKYGKEKALEIRALASDSIGSSSKAIGFELQQTIRLIQNLESEIALLDSEIKRIMDEIESPILSVPGIGYTLGAIILAEIGNIHNFPGPSQLLKFAGMEPSVYESGNYKAKDTPMVKRGSPYLRWALFQASRLVAYRDKTFGDFAKKKLAEGKHFFVVQGHVAKKLVRTLFSLLKNNQHFVPQS